MGPVFGGNVGVAAGGLDGLPSPDGLPMDMSGLKFNKRIVSISFFATLDAFSQIRSMSLSESMISLSGAIGSSMRFLVILVLPVGSSPAAGVAMATKSALAERPESSNPPMEVAGRTMFFSFSLFLTMVISYSGAMSIAVLL